MAGKIIKVAPRLEYKFQGGNTNQDIIVLGPRAIDTSWVVSGALIVRLHANSLTAGSTLGVVVTNVSITDEEPQTIFTATSFIATSTSITSTEVAGTLYVTALGAPIGEQIQVQLSFINGSTTTQSRATISVGLVLRDS